MLWLLLPYSAFASFLVGHVWRYRRDRFGRDAVEQDQDLPYRVGALAFRVGFTVGIAVRVIDLLSSGPHTHPGGNLHTALLIGQAVSIPCAAIGIVLVLVPNLISAAPRPAVTPVDRITLPTLACGLITHAMIRFDPYDEGGTRTAETLFVWFRSLFTLHPNPDIMRYAPLIYQARGLILLLLIAIWPYTRLASILLGPIKRLRLPSQLHTAAR
ncbi:MULTISPECIES: respiratory nitrate reductase subunit gamma [unclassified Nocardia]|uniref:respiratory nitrate reductase subunit gamma n=1 Tax=unclassified Nocardia TaxID=2637762 RepID=UPI001CE4156D|nr:MULTISPECIES: respiratory nitrate reductase subunit gamma [unclassified Nocardia]